MDLKKPIRWIASIVTAAAALVSGRRFIRLRRDSEALVAELRAAAVERDSLISDADEHARVLRALRESEARFRSIANAAPMHVWTVDASGQCTFLNKAWLDLTGHTLEEELGTGWMERTHPDDRETLRELYARGLQRREPFNFEYRVRRTDGSYAWCVAWEAPWYDEAKNYLGLIGAGVEITDRKLAEAEVKRVNEELSMLNRELEQRIDERTAQLASLNARLQEATGHKSDFLASMSHEVRTPLNGIIGFAELIQDGRAGPITPLQHEYLGDILESAHHLLELVSDVLDLAAIEAGKIEFAPEPTDLRDVVDAVRDALRPIAERNRVTVETFTDPTLRDIVIDRRRLKQVLFNYLANALKHSPPGSSVTMRARADDPAHFRLEVSDTGPGIRDEDLGRLFKDFEQIRASGGRASVGTGLGLALTRRIVEAQGGTVGVTTEVGKGSTFHARLPRVLARAPELR